MHDLEGVHAIALVRLGEPRPSVMRLKKLEIWALTV
jgi:hypothetical protein